MPADPGAPGSAPLAGVDTNSNAVRDDLDPFVQQYFGSKPRLLRAMSNLLVGLQATIAAAQPARAHGGHRGAPGAHPRADFHHART